MGADSPHGGDIGSSAVQGQIVFPCNGLTQNCSDDDIPSDAGAEIRDFEDEDAESFIDVRGDLVAITEDGWRARAEWQERKIAI